eukprot:403333773
MERNPSNHLHHQGCGCSEEAKRQDPHGLDLFPHIDMKSVDCFNQKNNESIKNVIRPIEERMDFSKGVCQSGYGKDLVVYIPFNGEIKVKSIIIIGGEDGTAPANMKIYKNVEAVDINILEEKKPIQTLDLNENVTGELEYLLNVSKFNNTGNIVLGFDENFGAKNTIIKFIGLKGEKLREKVQVIETVYEVRANLADHKTEDDFMVRNNLGM